MFCYAFVVLINFVCMCVCERVSGWVSVSVKYLSSSLYLNRINVTISLCPTKKWKIQNRFSSSSLVYFTFHLEKIEFVWIPCSFFLFKWNKKNAWRVNRHQTFTWLLNELFIAMPILIETILSIALILFPCLSQFI